MNRKVEFYFFKTLETLSAAAMILLFVMSIWFLGEPSDYGAYAETNIFPAFVAFAIATFVFGGMATRAKK